MNNNIDTKNIAIEIAHVLDKYLKYHIQYFNDTESILSQLPIIKSLIQENASLKNQLTVQKNKITLNIDEINNNSINSNAQPLKSLSEVNKIINQIYIPMISVI